MDIHIYKYLYLSIYIYFYVSEFPVSNLLAGVIPYNDAGVFKYTAQPRLRGRLEEPTEPHRTHNIP